MKKSVKLFDLLACKKSEIYHFCFDSLSIDSRINSISFSAIAVYPTLNADFLQAINLTRKFKKILEYKYSSMDIVDSRYCKFEPFSPLFDSLIPF